MPRSLATTIRRGLARSAVLAAGAAFAFVLAHAAAVPAGAQEYVDDLPGPGGPGVLRVPPPGPRPSAVPDPSVAGSWSAVYPWPEVAIHLHLLPNGKVLSWADDDLTRGRKAGFLKAHVTDIPPGQAPGVPTYIPNNKTNLFCSGHSFLPDGRLFVTGGHAGQNYYGVADVTFFDYRTNSWETRSEFPISYARWYGSALTLPNGDVLALAGTIKGQSTDNPLPQVWETARGDFRDLTSAKLKMKPYPRVHVAPDGRVVRVAPEQTTYFLDPSGTGKWTKGPNRKFGARTYAPSAMYEDGKILVVGGAKDTKTAPTRTAEVLDLNAGSPSWRSTGSMRFARRHANAVILPDGKVLVVGGSSSASFNDATGAVLAAEVWDPATGSWTTLASARIPRVYHSTAILLRDGRVLSTGGGRPSPKGGKNNENAEIFSPPYLFKGPRPTIASAPESVGYGQTFAVQTPEAAVIDKVRLVRLGSVTHAYDMNQRAASLGFTKTAEGLDVTAPSSPNSLPPGHYMLFIVDGQGVPSVAEIVRVG